jgi:hypothetical protein
MKKISFSPYYIALFLLTFCFLVAAIVLLSLNFLKKRDLADINSYDKCVAGGYPTKEIFPPVCSLPNGKSFTQTPVEGVSCTMEAKECPDGSYVGRSGPRCEFAACPINNMTK